MDFFMVLTFIGGLALFLYGMNIMGNGLEKLSGGKLEHILERLTSNKFKGVMLGFLVTAIIQSSSATTVMVVGFVNSGIMQLNQAIGIIMGANVGTTATAWILSLSGLQGDNFFIQLLKPASFSPILAFIGIIFIMFLKSSKKKNIGEIFLGFAVLMFGMSSMSGAVEGLAEVPEFTQLFTLFSNPLLGVLTGAVLTGIIQSSSASVGILQALSTTGVITFGSAIPIILGQNIGTCATALLSSIGTSKNARRAAMVHLYFNIIGTVIFLVVFYSLSSILHFEFLNDNVTPMGIAIVHTCFNILATLILLPFTKLLEKLAYMTIRDTVDKSENEFQLLDPRFLATPSFAIDQCRTLCGKMAQLSSETLMLSEGLLNKYSEEVAKQILENENKIDLYEDKLGTYLVQLSSKSLSDDDSREISMLLHCIGDIERISDHAVNILEAAQEMNQKELSFSEKAKEELDIYIAAINEIIETTFDSFSTNNAEKAKTVEPLEEVIDNLRNELKKRHIKRLRKGKCTIELGFVLSDLITNLERVADHCSNIAIAVIQIHENSFETHEYISEIKKDDVSFYTQFAAYSQKYDLSQIKKA